jgi:hypothetical protein
MRITDRIKLAAKPLHPVLPDAIPTETLYETRLTCSAPVAARIRSLLLTTISHLPVVLQSIYGQQDKETDETHIHAEVMTAGRNCEALEPEVVRLSLEDEVSSLSWVVVESTLTLRT